MKTAGYKFVTGLLLLMLPAGARADELSRSDKLKVLYSNQFAFDRRGVPLITVRIAEGIREVVIESDAPPRVLPDGEGGSEVQAGKRWKISIGRSRPASVEFFAVLARQPPSNLKQLRVEMAAWQRRKLRPRLMEIGSVFGVKGRVFDNRAFLLTDGPYTTHDKAVAAGETFARKYSLAKIASVAKLKRRPSASFEAVSIGSTTRIKVQDAIWFAPAPGKRLRAVVPRGRYVGSRAMVQNAPGTTKPRPFWGHIYVTVDRKGTMAVVNAVPADRMLAGLVPAEIFASAPPAALRAQAVAARGELLAKIGTRHMEDPYLLCSTVHCQVYAGAGKEKATTTRAVNDTRGLVLIRSDGRLVDTVYSAVCGGHSEHNDNVWPTPADNNLRGRLDAPPGSALRRTHRSGISEAQLATWVSGRPDTWCGRSRFNRHRYRWTKKITVARLNVLLGKLGAGQVRGLRVLSRGVSGRARLLQVTGSRGIRQLRGELNIRRSLGGLNSSMFVVTPLPAGASGAAVTGFSFAGGGWGHGVGMCQTGATGMGAAGKSYKKILQHYYSNSTLQPLY